MLKQSGRIPNKWEKIKRLRKDQLLKKYVPETTLFNLRNLEFMLDKHSVVYVKPTRGMGGSGVIKVQKNGLEYTYHFQENVVIFGTIEELYEGLKSITKKRKNNNGRFMIQQGIPLLKYEERIFDLRVMVQRNKQNLVEITGILGRVAHPQKAVTNVIAGGEVLPLEVLLEAYMKEQDLDRLKDKLGKIGKQIASLYEVKAIGIDIGMDSELQPWIIEINFKPNPFLFKYLPNKEMFKKIMAYRRFHRKSKL